MISCCYNLASVIAYSIDEYKFEIEENEDKLSNMTKEDLIRRGALENLKKS